MTPQEIQALQANAALTEVLPSYGQELTGKAPAYGSQQTPSAPPTTIAGGLAAMKSKIESQGPSGTDFEGLMKKYNVSNMIPSSLKSIMGSQKVNPTPAPMQKGPMMASPYAQQAADTITGAMGTVRREFQPIKDLQARIDLGASAPGMRTSEAQTTDMLEAYRRTSGGSPTALGVSQVRRSGLPYADTLAGGLEATGEAMVSSGKNLGESFGEIDLGIRKVAQGDMSGLDQIFRKGLFQGISGASGVVFSPVTGAFSQAPEPVKQALGQAVKFTSDVVDGSLSTIGVDPNSMLGQNIKAGMIALMDVAPILGASKTVRAGVKGAGETVKGAAKGAFAKAAPYGGKFLEGTMIAGKHGAKLLNDATGKIISAAKKTGQWTGEQASNALWSTPAKVMKEIQKNRDEFLEIGKNIDGVRAESFGTLAKTLQQADDVLVDAKDMYKGVKETGQKFLIQSDPIQQVLQKYGVEFKKGRLVPTGKYSTGITPEDLAELNRKLPGFIKKGKSEQFTVQEWKNLKKSHLDPLIDFKAATRDRAQQLVDDISFAIKDQAWKQVDNLKEADELYEVGMTNLNSFRKEFMDWDKNKRVWEMKPKFDPDTMTRMLQPRYKKQLEILDKANPGLRQRLEVLKLHEIIDDATNRANGAQNRQLFASILGSAAGGGLGAATGGTMSALLGGPVGALAGFILTNPKLAANMFARMSKSPAAQAAAANTANEAAKETVKKATTSAKTASAGVKTNLSSLKQKAGKATTKGAKGAADVGGAASGAGVPPEM